MSEYILIPVFAIYLFTTESASKPTFSYDPGNIPFFPVYDPIL